LRTLARLHHLGRALSLKRPGAGRKLSLKCLLRLLQSAQFHLGRILFCKLTDAGEVVGFQLGLLKG